MRKTGNSGPAARGNRGGNPVSPDGARPRVARFVSGLKESDGEETPRQGRSTLDLVCPGSQVRPGQNSPGRSGRERASRRDLPGHALWIRGAPALLAAQVE